MLLVHSSVSTKFVWNHEDITERNGTFPATLRSTGERDKEDGRAGTFVIGNDHFPALLLDIPGIVESYKTYDDNVLIKTADIGQIIMVREESENAPDGLEYKHGLTPPMRDARRRRFRREPDLNPELVQRVEKDLVNIMAGGTAENVDILFNLVEQEQANGNACNVGEKVTSVTDLKAKVPNAGEPERSESEDSDDSI
ncbi:hypothetical protein Syun_025875 [Stephania yunnanensis]|uniref:TAFII55 protein conserved region domain-containing protein n=1 Tax=Stephania yunnanensis TaxID=152371 RepID=A0AAP0ESH2_9MAGN